MRLIHTANALLDRSYAGIPLPAAVGNACRARRREVLENIIQRAASWPADAVLIAGNLFEHDRVTPETVTFLRQTLGGAGVPVLIAPGPRDPFAHDSPYARMPWPENVVVFDTPAWRSVALERVPLTVHGLAAVSMAEPDILPALSPEPDGRTHVALAHGWAADPEAGLPPHPLRGALAYAAFGMPTLARTEPAGRVEAAPAPEPGTFDDADAGAYLEIETDGAEITVMRVACGRMRFLRRRIDASSIQDEGELLDALTRHPDADADTILEVVLRGPVPPEWLPGIGATRGLLTERVAHLRWIDETEPDHDWDALANQGTVAGDFYREVTAALTDADRAQVAHLRRARAQGWAAFQGECLPLREARAPVVSRHDGEGHSEG